MNTNVVIVLIIGLGLGFFVGDVYGGKFRGGQEETVHEHTEMETMMEGMVGGLVGLRGEEFEKAFLDEMIVHHEGAIKMAELIKGNSDRHELLHLGEDIIIAQTKEIQMMKGWRKDWFID